MSWHTRGAGSTGAGCAAEEDTVFVAGVVFADYGDFVEACAAYLVQAEEREQVARSGFELTVQRDMRTHPSRVLEPSCP